MLPPKLIFIEGLPGAGRSTAAELVAERLQRRGIVCRWYHDSDAHHPIQPPLGDPSNLTVHMVRQWQDFIDELQTYDGATIVENRLWMRSAMQLFMRTDSAGALRSYQHAVAQALKPVTPALVYLEQSSVAMALGRFYGAHGREQLGQEIVAAEQERWFQARELTGFEGWLYFLAEWMALLRQLFEEWPYASLLVSDAYQDWQRSYDVIVEQLTSRHGRANMMGSR